MYLASKIIPLALLLAISLLGFACSKHTAHSKVYKGVVVNDVCCNVVIRTIGPSYLGQMGWIDSSNSAHPIYDHVFKVANPCQFPTHQIGDTITFTLTDAQVQSCACCMIYVATPEASFPIAVQGK